MRTIYHQIQSLLDEGLTVAVATITAVKGSVPREVGAKMIIHPYGKHVGTVGGGCGEAEVIRTGLDVITDGMPRVVHVDLTEEISMRSLGVCGGIMDVFVERWAPEDPADGLDPAAGPVSQLAGGVGQPA
jgi:xanthine dehydrogenase accessory factor